MSNNPLIFQQSHQFPPVYNHDQQQLHLLQYSTAYFNPYEVKHRKRTTRAQLTVLEATFQQNNKPSSAVKKALAQQLDMPIRNVQVWFQNRRAKDKNIALKAKAKADQEAVGTAGGGSDGSAGSPTSDAGKAADPSSPHDSVTPPATASAVSDSPAGHLSPPSNLALRRGSAPNLGLASTSPLAPSSSTFSIRTSPQQNARSASDSLNSNPSANHGTSLEVPSAAMLARRKSLPAFHPALQQQLNSYQMPQLPSGSNQPLSSNGDPQNGSRLTGEPPSLPSNNLGHGGVYRPGSLSSGRTALAPYPLPSRGLPGTNYRSGSTPGTGVFRVPANPNPSGWGLQENGLAGGLRPSSGPLDSINQPFSFPPRPYTDVPNTGPLPSEDFRFGDSSNSGPTFRDSPPDGTETEEDRINGLAHSHRFGSLASELSIESDATGTTATTATSSNGFSPLTNPPLSAMSNGVLNGAFRSRYPGGLGLPQSFNNPDIALNSSISYGMGSGSIAGLPGFGAEPVNYPPKFDPESRRASCPAHFIDSMNTLNVDNGFNAAGNTDSSNHLSVSPSFRRNMGIRKVASGLALKSQLGIRIPGPSHPYAPAASFPETTEEAEDAPLTAIAGGYNALQNFTLDGSNPSTASDTRHSGSPDTQLNGFSHPGSVVGSFDDKSFGTPAQHHDSMPLFMNNFTQEPTFDNSSSSTPFYNHSNGGGSQTHLGQSQQQGDGISSLGFQNPAQGFGDASNFSYGGTGFSDPFSQGQQQQPGNSFLHAPAPVPALGSSSLAGALHGNSFDSESGQAW